MQRTMRHFAVVVIANLVAAGVAVGFSHFISEWTPCGGEGLACNMNSIVGIIVSLTMAVISFIAFVIAVMWRRTRRAVNLALAILCILLFVVLVFALQQNSLVNGGLAFHWNATRQLLQFVAAPALVVLIQWGLLRIVVTPRDLGAGPVP